MCTMAMIQLSGPVIFQGLLRLGNIHRFLFEAKVVFFFEPAVLQAFGSE